MFDIPFHINLFNFLIELEYPLNTSNKITDITLHPLETLNRTHIALLIYFFNWTRISIKYIKKNNRHYFTSIRNIK